MSHIEWIDGAFHVDTLWVESGLNWGLIAGLLFCLAFWATLGASLLVL